MIRSPSKKVSCAEYSPILDYMSYGCINTKQALPELLYQIIRAKQNQNNSMSSTHGLDALAALCGKTVSAVARNNGNGGGSNDKSQRSGEESTVAASAPAPPRPGPASSGQIPASNVGGTALPVFYQQQQLGQQQYFPQQQAAGMQQAAVGQQALASMPPQLLQAMLSSQPGIGQALQAALAGGGVFAPAPQQPVAAASLAAAFPGLAASAEQQQQQQAQIQMIAAQLLAAQQQAAVGQMQQPTGRSFWMRVHKKLHILMYTHTAYGYALQLMN